MDKYIYNDPQEALQILNERYAFINANGKSLIFHECLDHNGKLVVEPTTIKDFKPLYGNRMVQVGTKKAVRRDKDDEPIYKPLGEWWVTHPERRTYYRVMLQAR